MVEYQNSIHKKRGFDIFFLDKPWNSVFEK